MSRVFLIVAAAMLFAGCASGPKVSELQQGVQKTVFIQHGEKPLAYTTGVIDASSFWAEYGSGVSAQTGGWLWSGLASSGQSATSEKSLTNAQLVEGFYADYNMVPKVSEALLPEMSRLWGQSFANSEHVVLEANSISVDPETEILTGYQSDADLILMVDIRNINLTERFSAGGAFAAGFTMGTNKKSLTAEVMVMMHAFKPDHEGNYKEVWWRTCGANYVTMKTSYYMEELMESKDKMTEILDEASQQSIEGCGQLLSTLSSQ